MQINIHGNSRIKTNFFTLILIIRYIGSLKSIYLAERIRYPTGSMFFFSKDLNFFASARLPAPFF